MTEELMFQTATSSWRTSLKKVADNPEWIEMNLNAMLKELKMNNPDTAYLREKMRHIDDWIKEIDKFHYKRNIKEVV